MAVSFIQLVNTTVSIVEQELLTFQEFATRSLVYMFCRSLFVLLSSLFWSLCCLFFFDLQILITFGIFRLFFYYPLVFPNLLTRRVPLLEQELITLLNVLCVCFVDRCLSFILLANVLSVLL
jgi:hypothetical protein